MRLWMVVWMEQPNPPPHFVLFTTGKVFDSWRECNIFVGRRECNNGMREFGNRFWQI